jgi:hypothetical protein
MTTQHLCTLFTLATHSVRTAAIVFAMTLIGTAGPAYAASERRETLSGIATGETTRAITFLPGEVILMRGFDFRYLNGDHHIKTIGVLPETGTSLSIQFRDRNRDDPMAYETRLTKVTVPGVISPPTLRRGCSGGTCTFPLQAPPNGDYVFVLRGFQFLFLEGEVRLPFPDNCDIFVGCDHHLSVVGIQPEDGNIKVTYKDQNGDDDYAVAVAYSYVPRSLIRRLVTVTGRVDAGAGTEHTDVDTSGIVAITGFRIGYVPVAIGGRPPTLPDNHILRFGYRITGTGVDVAFHDNGPDTKWEYQLNFVRFE